MSKSLALIKNYGLYVFLFFYGLFYHISSSEFWPITISKTWLIPEKFEYSMLQKPLFTLFLSLFHLLPLSSVTHLIIVKSFFALLGVFSLYIFIRTVSQLARKDLSLLNISLFIAGLLLVSPIIIENFFRVRADQICFLFFTLFIYFESKKLLSKSLICLTLVFFIAAKGIVFLIPACIILLQNPSVLPFIKKYIYHFTLASLSLLVWFINFNFSSLSYFINTLQNFELNNIYLNRYWHNELILLIISVFSCVYIFAKKDFESYRKYALSAVYFLVLTFSFPQSYPYFIASTVPFIYMMSFILISHSSHKFIFFTAIAVTQILWFSTVYSQKEYYLYSPSLNQLRYINEAEKIIKSANLTYLDGMGIMPQSRFASCYISPEDAASNKNCIDLVIDKKPDVVITTQRLSYVYADISSSLSESYKQEIPNFWVKKEITLKLDLANVSLAPPFLIFGFE